MAIAYRVLSPEEREKDRIERREKARRDQAAQQKWAIKQSMFEVAKNALVMKLPTEDIVKLTELTVEEIDKLKTAK